MKKLLQKFNIWHFLLSLIFGYLMGVLSWIIIHPVSDLQDYFTSNILPPSSHFFTGLNFLILVWIILGLIGYFRQVNIKLLIISILLATFAINFQSIADLSIFKINLFIITSFDFLSYVWFFQNVIFCLISGFFLYQTFFGLIKRNIRSDKLIIVLLVLLGSLSYSFLSILRHLNFGTNAWDGGGYDQMVWGFAHFKFLYSTIFMRPNLLGDHFEPILILISPIYWLWDNFNMLLILQAIAVSVGIIPIYLLAKKILKTSFAGTCLALAYLVFIGLQYGVLSDFHPLVLLVPVLAFMIYFIETNQNKKYIYMMLFGLLFKESIAIYYLFIGLYVILRKKYLIGTVTILTGILWYFFAVKVMIPWISGGNYVYLYMFKDLGDNPLEITKNILINPIHTLYILLHPAVKIETLVGIFSSTGFLALLSPMTLILTLPMILEKFLTTTRDSNWIMGFHYTSTMIPMMMIATIYGIRNILKKYSYPELGNILALFVFLCSLSVSLFYFRGSFPPAPVTLLLNKSNFQQTTSKESLNKLIEMIPENASVKAQSSIVPHLSHRERIYNLDNNKIETDYIIIAPQISTWPYTQEEVTALIESYAKQNYKMINENNTYLLVKENH